MRAEPAVDRVDWSALRKVRGAAEVGRRHGSAAAAVGTPAWARLSKSIRIGKRRPMTRNRRQPAPQKSHLHVWLDLMPRWGWVIIASVLVVVVESVVARFVTPAGSSLRTTWSLSQLAIGVIAVVGCHVFNFHGRWRPTMPTSA